MTAKADAQEPKERTEADDAQREEEVDAEIVPEGDGPHPELAPLVDEQLGASAELVVRDANNRHEGLVAMDAHDVELLLKDLTQQAQGAALRKWVYELPQAGKPKGLSIHGVQDITQRMNWTGKCSIRVLPATLNVEVEEAETDDGIEVFIVATIFAEDARTGAIMPGTSSEPRMMKLKPGTAKAKRAEGKTIREDNKVFDRFARTKAIGKASRNALASFIPEEVEQAVIALADQNSSLVERIQTESEARVDELPPPLDTPRAKELERECRDLYAEIRELAGGRGKVALTPGRYNGAMTNARHSEEAMEAAKAWLEERKVAIVEHYQRIDAEAAAKAG